MKADQIAINLISIRQAPFEEAIAAAAGAGFRLVEFHIPALKKWLAEGPHTPADARAALSHLGLRSIGGFETALVCFGDEPQRRENHGLLRGNAELLAALGGGVMVVGTDGPPEASADKLDSLRRVGRTMRELAESFDSSVKLAVEFNWGPLVKSLRSAMVVVEEADHPGVGILFDPAHYHCTASKFDDLTDRVIHRILHVHVDNMADKPGDASNCNADRVLPGSPQGILDLPVILGRIEAGGYRGPFSIEMFSDELWALPASQAAHRCYDAMKTLL